MEKMDLILEFTKQTLYYDTLLDHYEAEQKQPRKSSCKYAITTPTYHHKFQLVEKQLMTLYNHGKAHIYINLFLTTPNSLKYLTQGFHIICLKLYKFCFCMINFYTY